MTIETLEKRIEGKQKAIDTLNKKIARIEAAKSTNWEQNPYYYNERDLARAQKDLDSEKAALAKYQDQLKSEEEKANSRNIPAILDFLAQWKERVTAYYKASFEEFKIAQEEWSATSKEYVNWSNSVGWKLRRENREEYNRIENEYRRKKQNYQSTWSFLTPVVNYAWQGEERVYTFDNKKFQKMIDNDADAKYDFIIERTNAIVGTITDASDLKVGAKGDLNGIIIGENGKAKVQTIGAGGYNADVVLNSGRHGQCYHFRTLIHPVK